MVIGRGEDRCDDAVTVVLRIRIGWSSHDFIILLVHNVHSLYFSFSFRFTSKKKNIKSCIPYFSPHSFFLMSSKPSVIILGLFFDRTLMPGLNFSTMCYRRFKCVCESFRPIFGSRSRRAISICVWHNYMKIIVTDICTIFDETLAYPLR